MSNQQFNFTATKVVVTGGAQGIGFEIAKQFLQSQAEVCIWDFSTEALKIAQKELASFGAAATFEQVDVTDRKSCAAAAAKASAVQVLVNNAGITRDKSFGKMSPEEWDAVINTNLTGLFNVTKSLQERFSHKPNRIINIASVVALYGNFGQANYVAAKSGVIGFTKTLARELGRKGFTVNAIAPGFIETAMTKAMPPEVLVQMAAKVPVGTLGRPEHIANACLFLASEGAAYINGTVLSVDGGMTI